jgi:hypothetical protein
MVRIGSKCNTTKHSKPCGRCPFVQEAVSVVVVDVVVRVLVGVVVDVAVDVVGVACVAGAKYTCNI